MTESNQNSPAPVGAYCNECGWQNPPGARYCSSCGTALEVDAALRNTSADAGVDGERAAAPPGAPAGPSPPSQSRPTGGTAPEEEASVVRAGTVIGAGVLLVVGLYLLMSLTRQAPRTTFTAPPPGGGQTATTELSPAVEEQISALRAEVGALAGDDQLAKQRELVAIYVRNGRIDLAAEEQESFAESVETSAAWRLAGDLLYDWMRTAEAEGLARADVAERAAAAYTRVLDEDPGNLDVRTDLATAYLSSNNPMQAVAEIRQVLDADSTHVQARFNYGVMLARIGRNDQALSQFEAVKRFAEPDSPQYRQAESAIASLSAPAGSPPS